MKNTLTLVLMLICIIGYAQEENLPTNVESAFQVKYADTRIEDWWEENDQYYLDFSFKGNSYTAVYNQEGVWVETSEIISELYIPQSLNDFIKKTFPSATISYCEEVQKADLQNFIRVNLIDANKRFQVICCDREGKNITIQDTTP